MLLVPDTRFAVAIFSTQECYKGVYIHYVGKLLRQGSESGAKNN